MTEYILNFLREDEGQDLIEYSLLITFIAIACAAIMGAGRPAVNQIWQASNNQLIHANATAAGG